MYISKLISNNYNSYGFFKFYNSHRTELIGLIDLKVLLFMGNQNFNRSSFNIAIILSA